MSLLTRPWARSIKGKLASKEMPPWFADPRYGEYSTDRSLKQTEIYTLVKWVDGGAAAGDPKDAPAPIVWPEDGWSIKPHVIVRGPSFRVPAHPQSNVIEWTTIIMPTGFTKDTWVTSIEIKPSDLSVTHHICIGFLPHRNDVQYYTPVWSDKPRDEEGVEAKRERPALPPGGPPLGARGGRAAWRVATWRRRRRWRIPVLFARQPGLRLPAVQGWRDDPRWLRHLGGTVVYLVGWPHLLVPGALAGTSISSRTDACT
jgi:hypothetical protein